MTAAELELCQRLGCNPADVAAGRADWWVTAECIREAVDAHVWPPHPNLTPVLDAAIAGGGHLGGYLTKTTNGHVQGWVYSVFVPTQGRGLGPQEKRLHKLAAHHYPTYGVAKTGESEVAGYIWNFPTPG